MTLGLPLPVPRRCRSFCSLFASVITLVTLVLLLGPYDVVDGLLNVIAFFRVASHHWALLIEEASRCTDSCG